MDVSRNASHTLNGPTTGLDTAATGESSSLVLDLLQGLDELGVVGLVVSSGREVSGHAVHVGGDLLRGDASTATARLAWEGVGELALTTSLSTRHGHAELVGHTTPTSAGEAALLTGGVEDGWLHEVAGHASSGLLHSDLVPGLDASLKLGLANIFALRQSNVERLAVDHALVHVGNGLCGIVRVAEAHETEALALAKLLLRLLLGLLLAGLVLARCLLGLLLVLLVLALRIFLLLAGLNGIAHDLGRCDGTELREDGSKLVVVDIIAQVLDVQVDTLVLAGLLHASGLVGLAELLLTLVLLLSTSNVKILALEVLAVELLDSLVGSLVSGEVDETEATVLAGLLVTGKRSRGDIAVLGEQLAELLVGAISLDVLDVDVCEVGLHLLELALAVLLGDVVADVDLLLVQQHAVDVLDGLGSGLVGLVVDETVALGVAVLILSNLAAEDVAKGGKGVVQGLVVDGDVEVLDEDVASAGLAQSWVALGPHDAARAALDDGVVQLLQGLLAIDGGVVVDIGVSERATGDGITADADGGDGADLGEELEEHGLGDGGVELTDVERGGRGVVARGGGAWGGSGAILSALGGVDGGVDGGGVLIGAVEAGVAEISSELVNGAGGSRGGHFDG